jgi:hypothetical protein
VSSGGLGGPAILPLSLANMAKMTKMYPEGSFSGIGGISTFGHALNYFLMGCGTVQVCTSAMLDKAVGPNVVKRLIDGYTQFLERNADRGWKNLDDFRGLLRDRIVTHSEIRRPDPGSYHGGYEQEGYAAAEADGTGREEPATRAESARPAGRPDAGGVTQSSGSGSRPAEDH